MQNNITVIVFHVESEAYQAFYELKKIHEQCNVSFIKLFKRKQKNIVPIEVFTSDVDNLISDANNDIVEKIEENTTAIIISYDDCFSNEIQNQLSKYNVEIFSENLESSQVEVVKNGENVVAEISAANEKSDVDEDQSIENNESDELNEIEEVNNSELKSEDMPENEEVSDEVFDDLKKEKTSEENENTDEDETVFDNEETENETVDFDVEDSAKQTESGDLAEDSECDMDTDESSNSFEENALSENKQNVSEGNVDVEMSFEDKDLKIENETDKELTEFDSEEDISDEEFDDDIAIVTDSNTANECSECNETYDEEKDCCENNDTEVTEVEAVGNSIETESTDDDAVLNELDNLEISNEKLSTVENLKLTKMRLQNERKTLRSQLSEIIEEIKNNKKDRL